LKEEGKGGFGRVYGGLKKPEERIKVAVKVMPHCSEKEKRFNAAEVGFLSFCDHPSIVKYFCSFQLDHEIWAVMEFLEGGTLDQAVKAYNFEDKQIAYVAKEVLKGLKFLHSENLVHRDLKSQNVMMSIKGEIKMIDFGLCVDMSDGVKSSMVGSPFWMPPEMIQRKPYNNKVDIWSLGVCLMELANGHAPNHKNSIKAMFVAATEGYPQPFEKPKMWNDIFKDFLSKCLQMNAADRPEASELLKHEFLKCADTSKDMRKILTGIFILNTVLPF